MKFVAIKDFANVKALGLDKADHKLAHENHVHKGTRFAVGKTEIFKDLREDDKTLVAQLIASRSAIVDCDANKPLIEKVDTEVKAEAKAAEAAGKPVSLPEMIATAVATALAQARPAAAPRTPSCDPASARPTPHPATIPVKP